MKDIDPFDEIENDSDSIIRVARDVIAGAVVIAGIIFMIWFWLFSAC